MEKRLTDEKYPKHIIWALTDRRHDNKTSRQPFWPKIIETKNEGKEDVCSKLGGGWFVAKAVQHFLLFTLIRISKVNILVKT